MGRTAFLAPLILTTPSSRVGPLITNLSTFFPSPRPSGQEHIQAARIAPGRRYHTGQTVIILDNNSVTATGPFENFNDSLGLIAPDLHGNGTTGAKPRRETRRQGVVMVQTVPAAVKCFLRIVLGNLARQFGNIVLPNVRWITDQ
jgi:hypothetical protein